MVLLYLYSNFYIFICYKAPETVIGRQVKLFWYVRQNKLKSKKKLQQWKKQYSLYIWIWESGETRKKIKTENEEPYLYVTEIPWRNYSLIMYSWVVIIPYVTQTNWFYQHSQVPISLDNRGVTQSALLRTALLILTLPTTSTWLMF